MLEKLLLRQEIEKQVQWATVSSVGNIQEGSNLVASAWRSEEGLIKWEIFELRFEGCVKILSDEETLYAKSFMD